MDIEVEFEEGADPFGSFADEPAAAERLRPPSEPPAADTSGADDAFLSPADLSAMGRFGRSRSSANLIQDDVFGGSSGGPTPSPSKPADSFSSADFGDNNPFGAGGRTTDSSPFDTPSSEQEAKATEAAADDDFGEDPFASLGEPLVNEEPASASSRSNFGAMTGGGTDTSSADPFSGDFSADSDPFGAGADAFAAAFDDPGGGADPLQQEIMTPSLSVDGCGKWGQRRGEFNERVTSTFKIGKNKSQSSVRESRSLLGQWWLSL